MKRLLIVLGGVGLVAAMVFFATPKLVEERIDDELQARAPAAAVSWDSVDWRWDNTFAVSGLRYERGDVEVSVDTLSGSVQIRDLWDRDFDVSFDGTVQLDPPESVRVQRAWTLSGDVSTGERRGTFQLTPTTQIQADSSAIEVEGIEGVFRLPSGETPWQVDATLRQPRIFVDTSAAGALEGRAPAVDVSAGGATAPTVRCDDFVVDLYPAEPEFGAGQPTTRPDGVKSAASTLRRLWTRALDLRVQATGGTIQLGDQKEADSKALVEDLAVRKSGLQVGVRGDVFDGAVAVRAVLSPWQIRPVRASISATDIELQELPTGWLPVGSVAGRLSFGAVGVSPPTPTPRGPEASGVFRAEVDDLVVTADGLADRVLPLDGISLSAEWARQVGLGRFRVSNGRLNYDGLELDFEGERVESPGGPVLKGKVGVQRLECQSAVERLPLGLLGPYRDVALKGTSSPRFSFEYPVRAPERLTIDLDGFPGDCRVEALNAAPRAWPDIRMGTSKPAATAGSDLAAEASPRSELESVPASWSHRTPDDVFWLKTPFVLPVDEGVSPGADVEVGPGLPEYVPLSSMPDYVGGAAYLSEEVNFYDDGAWNVHLIQRALRMNLSEGRFVYGGSTVTQQLVKNLFLTRDKTIARKVQEALIAWRMQQVVSKARVLELYLNSIEYGQDLYGIGPAARRYFGREASELTVLQAVFLATIKPAPWYGDRFFERGQTPERGWWPERIEEITRRLHKHDYIDEQQLQAAKPFVVTFPKP